MTRSFFRMALGTLLTLSLGLATASAQVAQRMAILGGQEIVVGPDGASVRTVCIDEGRPAPGRGYRYGSVTSLPGGGDAIVTKMVNGRPDDRQPLSKVLHDPNGPITATPWLRIEGQGGTGELLIKPLRNERSVTYKVEIGSPLVAGKDGSDLADGAKLTHVGGNLGRLNSLAAQLKNSADYPIPALRDMAFQKTVWECTDGGLNGDALALAARYREVYRDLVGALGRDLTNQVVPGLSANQANFLALSMMNGDLLTAPQCRHLRALGMAIANPGDLPISRGEFLRLLEEAKQLEGLINP